MDSLNLTLPGYENIFKAIRFFLNPAHGKLKLLTDADSRTDTILRG